MGQITLQYFEAVDLKPKPTLRRWVEQALGDGWRARVHLVAREGRLEVLSLAIYPVAEISQTGLSTEALRKVRLGVIRRYAQTQAARATAEALGIQGLEVDAGQLHRSPRRPGPKGHSMEHYALVAAAYVDALSVDGARGVVKRVASRLGPGYSRQTAAKQIARARELDLLGPAPGPRKAGGELTALARALLRSERAQARQPASTAEGTVESGISDEFAAVLEAGRRGTTTAAARAGAS